MASGRTFFIIAIILIIISVIFIIASTPRPTVARNVMIELIVAGAVLMLISFGLIYFLRRPIVITIAVILILIGITLIITVAPRPAATGATRIGLIIAGSIGIVIGIILIVLGFRANRKAKQASPESSVAPEMLTKINIQE